MSIDRALAYIENFKLNDKLRIDRNKRYYDCKNDAIHNRVFEDSTKPNNKFSSSWGKYIVTLITGYFIGKPVTYWSKNESLLKLINSNLEYDSLHNQEIEKDCSIYGVGYELIYIEDKKVKYKRLPPQNVIPIFSNGINNELLYAIHFFEDVDILTNNKDMYIEIYSKESIRRYLKNGSGIKKIDEVVNVFKNVNINVFLNNADMRGDFEHVIRLIDGYDFALSDTANFREELNDSYLVFKNTNLEQEDIIQMKQKRVISIEDTEQGMQSNVSWLNKDSNDAEQENYKQRLSDDIKRFSFVSDIDAAKSHTTAASAKIGLLGIEQVCVEKESYFRKALLNRIKLICEIEFIKNNDIDYSDVRLVFVRNMPIDMSVIGDTAVKLSPFVSKRTLLSQLPFISDVDEELKRKQEEEVWDAYKVGELFGGEDFDE